jgi:hypothetical protein
LSFLFFGRCSFRYAVCRLIIATAAFKIKKPP